VIVDRRVLAVEAAEGTDAMLERVAGLREAGRLRLSHGVGVLVKAPKRQQDRRFDLPSIGPETVARVARAGLAGIGVVAGATIVAEPQCLVEAADRAGLFVFGYADSAACP
jgi:UDP-2,3-diacylglucosamine hydrolase